ncbi:MAG TPA: amidohydrolase [Vicinamibacteria bacterium]
MHGKTGWGWVVLAGSVGAAQPPADLVLRHGKVVTVDKARPLATAVAIKGDRIVGVGSDQEIAAHVGPRTEVIELHGRLALPGFIEGHGHFLGLGEARMQLDLTGARSWDDIVAQVAEAARGARPGAWIRGRGWHQEKWQRRPEPNVDGVPLHHPLSKVSPANPVVLTHASGHALLVNARALEALGIDRRTPDPPGGQIVRDAQGEPTGLLRETARDLVRAALARAEKERPPAEVEANRRRAAELAAAEALSKGVTTFHDAGSSFETIDFFRQRADAGQLGVRLYVMVRYASNDELAEKLPRYRVVGHAENFLTVRSIKRQIDGALGPHGAWLLSPYLDLPTSTGLNLEPPEVIRRTAQLALQHGYQLNVHAIGDRANREILDIYQEAFGDRPDREQLRWRVEHAQHLDPQEVPRFKRLGVIASMQGIHATSDGPWVLKRLGPERAAAGAYVWRKLLDAGVVVTNGTDCPVEDIDPIASFHASVTRRTADGGTFYPEQRMTREEALHSYTLANAYAAFEEDLKGSLTPGKLADLVVLTEDILTVPEERIRSAKVALTVVGGRVAYRRP